MNGRMIKRDDLSFFRQILPAVVRALKTRPARLALCQELEHHVTAVTNKAMLEPLQVFVRPIYSRSYA